MATNKEIGSARKYYLGSKDGKPVLLTNVHSGANRSATLVRMDAQPNTVVAGFSDGGESATQPRTADDAIEVLAEVYLDANGVPQIVRDKIGAFSQEPNTSQGSKRQADDSSTDAKVARPAGGSILMAGENEWQDQDLPAELTFSDTTSGTYADGSLILTGRVPLREVAKLIAPESIIGSGLRVIKEGSERFIAAHDLATFIVRKQRKGIKAERANRAKQTAIEASNKPSRTRYSGKTTKPAAGAAEKISKEIQRASEARQRNSAKRREGTNQRRKGK